jgi:hypothetical protein
MSKQEEMFKVFTENIPMYSFTNTLYNISLSQNSETILFQTVGKISGKTYLYVSNKNGFGIKEIFSPGNFTVGNENIFFDNTDLIPVINGKGTKVILGLRPVRNVEKKTDYILVYDIQKQTTTIFPLRILVAGCNYTRFPNQKDVGLTYSLDFEGTKIVSTVEYGYLSTVCEKFDTGLAVMNIDGSNQSNLHGPEEFVLSTCSFYWKKVPKSPHQATLSYSGDKVIFFGQVYETTSPYEKNGDLFMVNTNGSNLKQLTKSKRFDEKPESLGSFKSNFYTSDIFFKQMVNNEVYLSSLALVDSSIKNYFTTTREANFVVSGDSRKIFMIDPLLNESLVYFDTQKEKKILVIDRTWSGAKNNYGNLLNMSNSSLFSSNLTNFDGGIILIPVNREWCYQLQMDQNLLTPQITSLEFKVGSITAKNGKRLISLSSPPYMKNNRIMIPTKLFAEIFGIRFIWNPKDQSLQLKENGNNLTVYPNKKYLFYNGKKLATTINPEIVSNQVYIPAAWAKDYFGDKLVWNSKTQIIVIERTQS